MCKLYVASGKEVYHHPTQLSGLITHVTGPDCYLTSLDNPVLHHSVGSVSIPCFYHQNL